MARCPAHGNRIQLNPSRAVNLFGATPQPDCRRTLLGLQQQVFGHWHHYKQGTIDWPALQQSCLSIRQAFVSRLQQVVELVRS